MTKDEAKIVISILKDADGGCSSCVISLVIDFKKEFPNILTDDEILKIIDSKYIDKDDIEV